MFLSSLEADFCRQFHGDYSLLHQGIFFPLVSLQIPVVWRKNKRTFNLSSDTVSGDTWRCESFVRQHHVSKTPSDDISSEHVFSGEISSGYIFVRQKFVSWTTYTPSTMYGETSSGGPIFLTVCFATCVLYSIYASFMQEKVIHF